MSEKNKSKINKLRGKPFDEYRCFYIKDFRKGDSIRVSLSKRERVLERGVVIDVDLSNCLIHYKNSGNEEKVTTINRIVTLEGFLKDFLKE